MIVELRCAYPISEKLHDDTRTKIHSVLITLCRRDNRSAKIFSIPKIYWAWTWMPCSTHWPWNNYIWIKFHQGNACSKNCCIVGQNCSSLLRKHWWTTALSQTLHLSPGGLSANCNLPQSNPSNLLRSCRGGIPSLPPMYQVHSMHACKKVLQLKKLMVIFPKPWFKSQMSNIWHDTSPIKSDENVLLPTKWGL